MNKYKPFIIAVILLGLVSVIVIIVYLIPGVFVDKTLKPKATTTATSIETAIIPTSFVFRPETVTLAKGTTVVWLNQIDVPITVTADDGSFDSGVLEKNERFFYVFNKKGIFTYHCTLYPTMKGKVVVK